MSQDLAPVLPRSVQVSYRGRRCSGVVAGTVPDPKAYTVDLDELALSDEDAKQPSATGPFPGSTKVFHDTACALFTLGNPTPSNDATLQALAERIAQDYYDWLTTSFDTVFFGVVAPDPNGLVDLISWEYSAERVTTRMRSAPLNADPEELFHQDPAISGCQDTANDTTPVGKTPGVEVYGPPANCTGGGATATAQITGGAVTGITITRKGSGYTSAPQVQFSQGDGTGAAATATIDKGQVTAVNITNGGSGYTKPPIVSFSGGGTKPQITRYIVYLEDGRLRQMFISTDCLSL